MGNYGVTPKYLTAADVVAAALFLAQRQSDSGGTNGGIQANGNPLVPLIGQGGANDPLGESTAYLQAQLDAIMCAVGFQVQSNVAVTTGNITNTSFQDVNAIFPDYVFNAPIAKTYLVHMDIAAYFTVGTPPLTAVFRVYNVTTNVFSPQFRIDYTALNVLLPLSFRCPFAMNAGNNTMRLQAAVSAGTLTAANGTCWRCITING